jgi:hypothetical protein
MPNIMAGSLGGLFPHSLARKLEVISVLTNNSCNLRCRHCYLNAPTYDRPLTPVEWRRFFHSLLSDVAPAVLSFAGKEPFLNRPSVGVLQDAVRLRNTLQGPRRTRIGVITNGTLVHRHASRLQEVAPDYFDISVDGLPAAHDAIRGTGAFAQLEPNLRWLVQEFGADRIWLTHTLTTATATTLSQVIEFYSSEFGIRCFSIGLFHPVANADAGLAFSKQQVSCFVAETLGPLALARTASAVEVILDVDVLHADILSVLGECGWANSDAPFSDSTHRFANGVVLRIRTAAVAVGLWRSVRVTPEGYWLAAEDLIDVFNYRQRRTGSLRDANFDARCLYNTGLASQRHQELSDSFKPTKETLLR